MAGVWQKLIKKFIETVKGSPDPVSGVPAVPRSPSQSAPPFPSAAGPSAPGRREQPNPYEAGDILGLSPSELRKRALEIQPFRTAWIGRVDTIPPRSDERTALIDRGLVLRGLLSEEQLLEIHRAGDLWLEHHESEKLAEAAAKVLAGEHVEELRRRKAAERAERKRLSAEKAKRRLEAVAHRRATDIVFLGRGVSSGLSDRRSHIEALQAAGLPLLASPADVAQALGLSVPRLRWLAFHTEAAERPHYTYFEIPKRTGGTRLLSAPHQEMAKAQEWILKSILEKKPAEKGAHGFVKKRSIVTNAQPHKRQGLVVNIDLKDFFTTVHFPRVLGLFRSFGYSRASATVLALLSTEAPRMRAELDGQTYFVAAGERVLPQGACTSPAISNLVCRKLDRRLSGLSRKRGWIYTRYADDLTFSAPREKEPHLAQFLASVRHILQEEGFSLNPKKFRVQGPAGRQTVTGLVVNDKLSVPREELRKLRAILYNARKTGLAAQNRDGHPHFASWLLGKISFVEMVDRNKGAALRREFESLTASPSETSSPP